MHISGRARSLGCILSGNVISLAELNGKPWGSRCGYAVSVHKGSDALSRLAAAAAKLVPRFADKLCRERQVTAPADGVVISSNNGLLTLRTGDGVCITTAAGQGAEFIPEVGQKLRCGDVICRISPEKLSANGYDGRIAVFFEQPEMITELHILRGYRRGSHRTAFYRLRKG